MIEIITHVSTNVTTLSRDNFNTHESILIILAQNVTEKVGNQMVFYFPSHLTTASAQSGEMHPFTQML